MNPSPVLHPPGEAKHSPALREEARWLYLRGSTFAEISKAIGVPMKTVQSWKRRGCRHGWHRPVPVIEGPGGVELEQSPFGDFLCGTGVVTERAGAWLAQCTPDQLRVVLNAVISVREGMQNPSVRKQARMIEKLKSLPAWNRVRDQPNDVKVAAATLAEVAGMGGECWETIKGVVHALEFARSQTR